jgi:PTH1 family peptidyl-tRNA hydrolase
MPGEFARPAGEGAIAQAGGDAVCWLIVGLGNPGVHYAHHRHNVGFQCIDHLAHEHNIGLKRSRHKALVGQGSIAEMRALLARPLTSMNDSGLAVGPLSRYYRIPTEAIVVIYDDIDLAFGTVRVRQGGSSGGHNGIKSIIEHLGTDAFLRVRVGVGRPPRGDPIDYVLHAFDADQLPVIARAYDAVNEIVECLLTEGVAQAMNRFNGRSLIPEATA